MSQYVNQYIDYLSDEKIDAAVAGDEGAMALVLESCERYLAYSATLRNIRGSSAKSFDVDEDAKGQLRTKLLLAIKHFKDK